MENNVQDSKNIEINEINKELEEKKKSNLKIYKLHRMLTFDLLFYYAIKFLFLNNVKGFMAKEIIITSAFWGLFKAAFQIPVTIFTDKVGNKKSLIIADLLQALSIVLIMCSNTLNFLIFANLIGAIAYAMQETAGSGVLNTSILEDEKRGKAYSSVEGKSMRNYYYIEAVSSIIAGILFEINGYIPFCISTIIVLISTLIATKLYDIRNNEIKEESVYKKAKIYLNNFRLAFRFIFKSSRLKALMLFSGIMYGMIMTMGTYEMSLLEELGVSAIGIGIIYAFMRVIAAIASNKHNEFHKKNKNKSLAIVGLSYTIAILIAGLISLANLPINIVVGIIILTYIVRYFSTGLYQVLIKKYITNFTNTEVFNKVYSANGMITGLGNFIICIFASIIVSYNNIKISMVIFGIIFFILIVFTLKYMSKRLGLKPEEYKRKDIDYKEYINLK